MVDTFVAAFDPYVRSRLPAEASGIDVAIREGGRWLLVELTELLGDPFERQRRGPLELFQEAVRFPTAALAAAGVSPVARAEAERSALPGDEYGLAPASSQDLGEAAWKAHVAWGIAKAAAVAGVVPASPGPSEPRVAMVGGTQADRALVGQAASGAGLQLTLWRNPGAIADGLAGGAPVLSVVDLSHPAAHQAIEEIAAAGGRVLAYGLDVDDFAQAAMMALGAAEVVGQDYLERAVVRLLPKRA